MARFRIANFHLYNPRARDVTSSQRNGEVKYRWVRLNTDWDHDEDIALLPWDERALWPWLLARAGKGNPAGVIDMTIIEIAGLTTLPEEKVAHAIRHLRKRKRIVTENVAGEPVKDGLSERKSQKRSRTTGDGQRTNADRQAMYRLRTAVFERDGYQCRYCSVNANRDWLVTDHIDPRGLSVMDNLATACRSCNRRKGDQTPEQAGIPLLPPIHLREVTA